MDPRIEATLEAQADELALLISKGDLPDQVRKRKRWSKPRLKRLLQILKDRSKWTPMDGHTAFSMYSQLQAPGIRRIQSLLEKSELRAQTDPDFGIEVSTTDVYEAPPQIDTDPINDDLDLTGDDPLNLETPDPDLPPSNLQPQDLTPRLQARTVKRTKSPHFGGLSTKEYMQAVRDLAGYAKDWVDLAHKLGVVTPTENAVENAPQITQINQINMDLRKTLIQAVQSGDTDALAKLARGTAPHIIDTPPDSTLPNPE